MSVSRRMHSAIVSMEAFREPAARRLYARDGVSSSRLTGRFPVSEKALNEWYK